MAGLVQYDPKFITANYSSLDKRFIVTANEPLPRTFGTAEFKLQGGAAATQSSRKFRFEGLRGGIVGGPRAVMPQTPYIENMSAPPRFQTITVVALDANKREMTATVNVTIDAPPVPPTHFLPTPIPPLSTKRDPSALTPIDIGLPGQHFVRITAPIPDAAGSRPTFEGRNEGNATFTWRAGELPGFVYWDIAWGGNGAGVDKGGIFTVTTTVAKGAQAGQTGGAGSQVTVQPYAIKMLENMLDPDA